MSRYIGPNCDPYGHFFKITNEDENHNGFQYKDGLNILQEAFNIKGSCVPGGLYFTTAKYIYKFLDYGVNLRDVTLPFNDPNLKMVEDPSGEKWRADRIILGAKYPLSEIKTHEYLISKGARKKSAYYYMYEIAKKEENFDSIKYLWAKNYISLENAHLAMMIIACEKENIELAQSLTAEGVPEKEAQSVILKIRLKRKEWDLATTLIKNGASIDKSKNKSPSQILIASSKHIDLINTALNHGVDLSCCTDDIIWCAIKSESLDLIKSCIKYGYLDLRHINLILQKAAKKGNLEIIVYLSEYLNWNGIIFEEQYENLLCIASKRGHLDIVKLMINKKSQNQKNINCVIHKAINANQLEIARFLLNNRAIISKNASDLIIGAVEKNSLPMVKFLIENKVNFKVKNESPLCLASEKGYLNIVKYLVEKGSNVKANRNEAICRAVSNNHLETVRFLHENGAKIHVRNDFLIKTATEKGYADMICFLMGNGEKNEKGNKGVSGKGIVGNKGKN